MGLIKPSINITVDTSNEFITPEMFGAVGDGINDDTNAIQEAFNHVSDNSVVLLNGTYKVTSTINVNSSLKINGKILFYGTENCLSLNNLSNIEIFGGTIIALNDMFHGNLLDICNSSDIVVKTCLKGYTSEGGTGVYLYNKTLIINEEEIIPEVKNCKFDIIADNFYQGLYSEARVSSIRFCDFKCHFDNCYYGLILGNAKYNEHHNIYISGTSALHNEETTYLLMQENSRYNNVTLNTVTQAYYFNDPQKTAIIYGSYNTIELISKHNIIDDSGENFYTDTGVLNRSDSCLVNISEEKFQYTTFNSDKATIIKNKVFNIPKTNENCLEYHCNGTYNASVTLVVNFAKITSSGTADLSRIRFDVDEIKIPKRVEITLDYGTETETCEIYGLRINSTINLNHLFYNTKNIKTMTIKFVGAFYDLNESVIVRNIALECSNSFGGSI